MRPHDPSKPSYIAKVEKIVSDDRGSNVKVHVRWYYRPEEVVGGRKQFHGTKEVFLSDHYDVQGADTIEGKCKVHTFKNYTKLDAIGNDDFYSRFQYYSSTGDFNPDRIAVYCKCEMPYNPDDLMIQCDGCRDCLVVQVSSCLYRHDSGGGYTNGALLVPELFVRRAKGSPKFSCYFQACSHEGRHKAPANVMYRYSEPKILLNIQKLSNLERMKG
ncbi:chromatin remodeling protein SHL-like isoform X1 [Cynara cardunculus var. scolymus]|uniref:chromatin remodeling protein SHL-like isoform X1 n=1 Tax=Cynara cardunculus var. scolymus TaxID=59895 RepID=UPI000D62A3EE|nr:chromatin remodeling protein SHL-like isoform X1 [Cynara cardunculus var. scolymus]